MYLSKNSSTRTPSHLSTVAIAVISINAALISANTFAENSTQLETLVVTGEKIDKDIKDTTTAVTVIDGESYASGEAKKMNDVVTQAPNVTTAGFGTINIRGINGTGAATGSNAYITGSSPRITTTVDGVSEAWAGYNYTPTGLWDTQAVEVLRGPQSTYQGANAIGGAVVIQTNDPSFDSESAIRLGLEKYDNSNIKKNIAVMNSGTLIEDELAYRLTFDGTTGEGWLSYTNVNSDAPDLDDAESTNFRGKLLWNPSNIDGLSAKLSITTRNDEGEFLDWASDYNNQALDLSSENTRIQDSTSDTVSLDIDYQISDGIKNTLQISSSKQDSHFDEYTGKTQAWRNEETTALENRILITPQNSRSTSLIGLYLSQTDTLLDVDWNSAADFDANGTKKTLAFFGETTFEATEKLAITAGGRIERMSQDRKLARSNGSTLDHDETETTLLPKLSATYILTSNTTLGGSIRKGYNAGGAGLDWSDNSYYTYDKEEVTAYEFSSKSHFDSFILNANIFYNDYSGYQAYTSNRLVNVKSVHTYGAELEATVLATDNLEIRGSIGTLQTKVDSTDADTSSWDGNEITYSPDLNLGLGFTQYIGDNWSFGADATYVGEYYSDLGNTEDYKAGDYVITNARVKYEIGDFMIDGYIKNLTNEDVVYLINRGTRASVGQTRTIGLSATYRM
ncbi:TonB-dependent receptor [Marinomonas sp. TW1]|uniref:TonB-dependent receptor n=1 Tax=Marinomonas sp. TW1 TaxID=1561203 RepID=UPI0007AF1BC7|nr:TonB-dependent receptor [Marinomonas sp. TW1]KZN13685.1 TonB-dependent receptor [Marinomonas sp. TW1]